MEHPKRVLARYNIQPKKSLGQNFLTDDVILSAIADAASISRADTILEIGSGIGDLTRLLAMRAEKVVTLEIDNRLIPILHERLNDLHNIEIVQADVLEVEPSSFIKGNFKVVGNLPYYITGAIFRHFYAQSVKPELMVVTIQKEVAQRITAAPGEMSILAVISQYFADISEIRKVKAGNFWPRPGVESAVIRMVTKQDLPLSPSNEGLFFSLVKVGFSQKRKQLQKNLRQLPMSPDHINKSLLQVKIAGQRRAESLSVAEWISLFQILY